ALLAEFHQLAVGDVIAHDLVQLPHAFESCHRGRVRSRLVVRIEDDAEFRPHLRLLVLEAFGFIRMRNACRQKNEERKETSHRMDSHDRDPYGSTLAAIWRI